MEGNQAAMYREILVPVDNSPHSGWAVDRAVEICLRSGGRITGNHVYAARLHDVRFRQLETGLPAQLRSVEELKKQRKVHDRLIEKGLQLIADSFLDQTERRCAEAGVELTRQLLEGSNYDEIIREANTGQGSLPSLIGLDQATAQKYEGGSHTRGDMQLGGSERVSVEEENLRGPVAGSSTRLYDLVAMGAHGLGRQPSSQLGGVVSRAMRKVEKDLLVVRNDRVLRDGRWVVCVDGSAYAYRALRIALEMSSEFGAEIFVCSAFDVEYHHVVFGNIKDVLSVQAAKVFKFEEQEALHNNIIDKGLLKLCQANLRRAEVIAADFPDVDVQTQVLIGKPFQCILQWLEEIEPSLLVIARHGSHRTDDAELGSQADNLVRLADTNVLLVDTTDVRPENIPWIEEDGEAGLEWTPDADVRMLRAPPFAVGIARKAVEEFVLDNYGPGANGTYATSPTTRESVPPLGSQGLPMITSARLDEAIGQLLPTHMQLIMGMGTAEELALAEVKAEEAMARTTVEGHDGDAEPDTPTVEVRCPHSGHVRTRERTPSDPIVWTHEAFGRLGEVPLIARPLARNTVERFARDHGFWRVTSPVMDENKQAMIEADEFDTDTMLVMFRELQSKQLKVAAEGVDGLTGEMRKFVDEAKASGVARCPLRDAVEKSAECPVDFEAVTPEEARSAVERLLDAEPAES